MPVPLSMPALASWPTIPFYLVKRHSLLLERGNSSGAGISGGGGVVMEEPLWKVERNSHAPALEL